MIHKIKTILILSVYIVFAFFLSTSHTIAQSQGLGGDVRVEITPEYPAPGAPFTARLADYGGALGTGALSWYANGSLIENSINKPSIDLVAPALGEPLTVRATRASPLGSQSISATVVPSEVDIVTESDTSAPYFYAGRRIPGLGTSARIIAIPHIFNATGKEIPSNELTYSWNIDNQNSSENGPILEIPLSNFGSPLVLLSIESKDRKTTYATTFYVENTNPVLAFYAYNPLTGLSRTAIQDAYLQATDEVSVRAQPYFIAGNIGANAQYAWSVNGSTVPNANTDPYMITLRKSGSGGASDIGFSVRNLTALSQFAQGIFRVAFK